MAGTFGKRTSGIAAPHPRGTVSRAPASPSVPTLSFDYRPKPFPMLMASVFLGALAVAMAWVAQGNDRGVILYHLIRLDPGQATVFWWAIAAVLGAGFLTALFGLILSVSPPREVTLDAAGITAPKHGFTTAMVTIRYAQIRDIRIVTVKCQPFLHLQHTSGKLSIAQSMLGEDFEVLIQALAERCTA